LLSKWGEVVKFINKIINKIKYTQFTTGHSKKKDMLVMGAKFQNQTIKQTDVIEQKCKGIKKDYLLLKNRARLLKIKFLIALFVVILLYSIIVPS
jgi:hypothetical protein